MTYIIAEPCIGVKDRSCVDVCPVDCIYEGEEMLYIHPDEWHDYIEKNKEFFEGGEERMVAKGTSG